MKVLFLTFYYEPDLCAGSFRNTPLSKALADELPEHARVDVITTMPTRYSSFQVEAPEQEEKGKITVRRIRLPPHRSGMLDQSRAFLTFALEVLRLVKKERYDLVYASSSRLMTAVLGALIARKKRVPLYLDIRDIFLDTIGDVLPGVVGLCLTPALSVMERFSFQSATKINLVSEGFSDYFESRYPAIDRSYHTNGVDDEFLNFKDWEGTEPSACDVVNVLYAGNFGESQGLHSIVPALAKHFGGTVMFTLIGDGGRKQMLIDEIRDADVTNVKLREPVNRAELINEYKKADVLFLHLNDYPAFLKVIPSKIFEYGAMGKPIWAGVAGFPAMFLRENVRNVAVFNPCDVAEAEKEFRKLRLEHTDRRDFVQRFSRANILSKMASDIIATGRGS